MRLLKLRDAYPISTSIFARSNKRRTNIVTICSNIELLMKILKHLPQKFFMDACYMKLQNIKTYSNDEN